MNNHWRKHHLKTLTQNTWCGCAVVLPQRAVRSHWRCVGVSSVPVESRRTPALPYRTRIQGRPPGDAGILGRGVNAALDPAPQAAHRDVIDFAVIARARSFDEVSPLSQINPFAESSPIWTRFVKISAASTYSPFFLARSMQAFAALPAASVSNR